MSMQKVLIRHLDNVVIRQFDEITELREQVRILKESNGRLKVERDLAERITRNLKRQVILLCDHMHDED